LLVVLIIFIAYKIPQLHYPFYCDEGWVYAPAVKTMAIHGPGLLPGALPYTLSRGHPLLFHFFCALWIRCLGYSNTAIHSFPLLVSVIFIIAVYECCFRLFGKQVAILALLLVCTQAVFYIQSSFVLPEIMVALCAFLSLYFYATDRFLQAAIFFFMLFFTKESGVVYGAVSGIHAVVLLFRSKESIKRRLLRLASVVIPALLIVLFFMLQKQKEGWFLLPEHVNLIHTDWNDFYARFRDGLYWTFPGHSTRHLLVFFIILLSAVPAVQRRNVRYLFLCLPAAIVYILLNDYIVEHTGDVVWMVLFLLFFVLAVYYLFRLDTTMAGPARRFIILLVAGFVSYLCFLGLSVTTYRYLTCNIFLAMVFLAVCIIELAAASGYKLYYAAIAGILLLGVYGYYSDDGDFETDPGVFPEIRVEMKEVAFLEKQNAYDKEVGITYGWLLWHYTDTLEGFLSTPRVFTKMKHFPPNPNTNYVVFGNQDILDYNDLYHHISHSPDYHLVFRVTDDYGALGEIYKHN